MKELVQSARSARRLIGLNRLLVIAGWSLTAAAGVFAVVVTCDRSFALGLPLGLLAGGLAALAIVVAMVWSLLTRPTLYVAAAALDGAAGLRERLSSSLYCHASQPEVDDPFVDAVHADALRVCRNITPRAHLRVRAPSSWWYCGSSIALAACCLLLPEGMLLNREEDDQAPPRE